MLGASIDTCDTGGAHRCCLNAIASLRSSCSFGSVAPVCALDVHFDGYRIVVGLGIRCGGVKSSRS